MGRGIIESGLFRSERYALEQRTSDPSSTSEGEMWIRTDLAPDTDQLATLRFDAGGSTWDVPIYDVAAATDFVEKAWRLQVNGATGFVPITSKEAAFPAVKYQHNGEALAAHDSTQAIPGISRFKFEQDLVDSWGGYSATDYSSAGYVTNAAVGSYAKDFNASNEDEVHITGWDSLSLDTYTISFWGYASNFTWPDNGPYFMDAPESNRYYVYQSGDLNTEWGGFNIGQSDFPSDEYHLVTIVNHADGGQVDLYLDDTQTNSHASNGVTLNPDFISLGGYNYEHLTGHIDDLRLYGEALTSSQVSNLYNTGSING